MTASPAAQERRRPAHATDGPAILSVAAELDDGPADGEFTRAVGERLRSLVRWSDIVVPQGTGRFGLLCHQVPDESAALVVADRLDMGLREPLRVAGGSFELSASVGVAAQTMTDQRPLDLLAGAEAARMLAVSWIADAVQAAAVGHEASVALFRPDTLDLDAVRAFAGVLADRLAAAGSLMPAGQGLLMIMPEVAMSDVLAMSGKISDEWGERTPVDVAAARLDTAGRPRHVTTGLPRR